MPEIDVADLPIAGVYLGDTLASGFYSGDTLIWPEANIIYRDGPPAVNTGDWSLNGIVPLTTEAAGLRFEATATNGAGDLVLPVDAGSYYFWEADVGEVLFNGNTVILSLTDTQHDHLPAATFAQQTRHGVFMRAMESSVTASMGCIFATPGQHAILKETKLTKLSDDFLHFDPAPASNTGGWTGDLQLTDSGSGLRFITWQPGGYRTKEFSVSVTPGSSYYVYLRTNGSWGKVYAHYDLTLNNTGDLLDWESLTDHTPFHHIVDVPAGNGDTQLTVKVRFRGDWNGAWQELQHIEIKELVV